MVLLVTMLLYALATTAQYEWTLGPPTLDDRDSLYGAAICYIHPKYAFKAGKDSNDRVQRRVISMTFLAFGMINRIQGLYLAPSLYALKAQRIVSHAGNCILMYFYGNGSFDSIVGSMTAIMVYRPLLSAFLTVRLCIDGLTSKSFEVHYPTCLNQLN